MRRLSQKLAMSSAEELPVTFLLQNDSKASLRALWKRELLEKHFFTYCCWGSKAAKGLELRQKAARRGTRGRI